MSKTDLQFAKDKLMKDRTDIRQYREYYEGEQPLVYSIEKLAEIFGRSTLVTYIQNWCAVVVDSALDRISFGGWDSKSQASNDKLDTFFKANDLKRVSRKIHEDAAVAGAGYAIFDQTDFGLRLFRNDPMNVTVIYDEAEPDKMKYAMKLWQELDWGENQVKAVRLNLYYPDVIEKYYALGEADSMGNFELFDEVTNPYAEIPVVHFKPAHLELKNVLTLQDAINKLFSDMMVTGEFNAFRQRYIITNTDVSELKSNPQSIWRIPKGDTSEETTQVGEFSASDLNMFLNAMDKLANSVAIISRTPKHYLMNAGASLSGEALHVMEAPLIKKCQQHIDSFTTGWEKVAKFVVPDEENLSTVWDKVETELPTETTEAQKNLVEIGIPLTTVLRKHGWSDDEIEALKKDIEEQKKEQANLASQALELARLNMQRNNEIEL